MDLRFSTEDEAFRDEVRTWLNENLVGEFAEVGPVGGPGRDHEHVELRHAWEKVLGAADWSCIGWPKPYGRGATLMQQVIFAEEYAAAGAPHRINHFGENLLGPTLIECGTEEQKQRFLPKIKAGEELWCQGYSEPGAGSDLAGVKTKGVRDGDEWVITGQKVWTSLAHIADWCFVITRTDPDSTRHSGLSYLLVPMRQAGIEIRPIIQMTGGAEFNEVFFDGARTAAENVVGDVGDGWRVAMATLGYERGVATLAQQIGFARELDEVIDLAKQTGAVHDPILADRLTQAWVELKVMRYTALRMLSNDKPGAEASVSKLMWAPWHQRLGELAMAVRGAASLETDAQTGELDDLQRLFLFSRADTIYGGSNEIQRDILARRLLGLPRS
ncbi:MAG TPA: acyl-CoA dehydrogenase family protein [Mycobacteriales bacterium]|nr:acyl-CoA dehydrogenase family protein [Mycobacteriales bacterium]